MLIKLIIIVKFGYVHMYILPTKVVCYCIAAWFLCMNLIFAHVRKSTEIKSTITICNCLIEITHMCKKVVALFCLKQKF